MSAVAFLLDQHMDAAVAGALLANEPSIVVQIVGQLDAPPLGAKDPELLEYAESNSLAIVTFDKRTMPNHVADRLQSGRHTYGVFCFYQELVAARPDCRRTPADLGRVDGGRMDRSNRLFSSVTGHLRPL
jgi:Domain of unknown function (DUF5615)